MTRCLIVTAHPLAQSLCHHLAAHAEAQARATGWAVTRRDLAQGFDPCLTEVERASYYSGYKGRAAEEMAELATAEVLILVFPTWWFGFPAVLKGWFDRVWAPGVAFDHSADFGPMLPRLTGLRHVLAVTTMGAPGWIDRWIMWRPLRRVLIWGIVKPCAPKARVQWLAMYRSEGAGAVRVAGFKNRITAGIARLR